jgi:hypothetical protein
MDDLDEPIKVYCVPPHQLSQYVYICASHPSTPLPSLFLFLLLYRTSDASDTQTPPGPPHATKYGLPSAIRNRPSSPPRAHHPRSESASVAHSLRMKMPEGAAAAGWSSRQTYPRHPARHSGPSRTGPLVPSLSGHRRCPAKSEVSTDGPTTQPHSRY